MALAMQTKVSSRASRAARRAVSVRCEAGSAPRALPLAAATFAAAALLATPSYAGVVMQKPQLKKVFQDDAPAPVVKSATTSAPKAPAVKAAPTPKPAASEGESSSGGLDPRVIALPVSVVTVFGGFFALAKADKDFEKFLASSVIKDSNLDGVGYEVLVKDGSFASAGKAKAGTKKTGFSFGKK